MTESNGAPAGVEGRLSWAVPASYAQERIWFAGQIAREAPVYHVVDRIRLPYDLPAATVLAALATTADRHETLRTSLRVDDGVLMQIVHPTITLPVTVIELGDTDDHELNRTIETTADQIAVTPFALDQAPLWRAVLLHREGRDWNLVFTAHHTIVDAASELNLHAELTESCAAAAQGRAANLPELPIQYADYAVWQRQRLAGPLLDAQLEFWRATLAGLPAVHSLPTDRPRPPERTFAGADLIFGLPPEVEAHLPELIRDTNATPFMGMLAAFVALLSQRSTANDIVVGVPMTGRDRPELQPLIGMFVNMVVLRFDTSDDPTFADLVARVRDTALAAWDHQEMPYQKLVELLAVPRQPGVPPLYQLGFNYLTTGFNRTVATAEDDLMLEVWGSEGRIEYNTALFDPATIEGIAQAYAQILGVALRDPQTRLSDLIPPQPGGAPAPVAVDPVQAPPVRFVPPRTAAEELVAGVWADVLGVDRVGAEDEFFALGGHSLLALRVIARTSAAAGVDLSIQAFFADPTVAGVAREVENALAREIDDMSDDEAQRLLADEKGSVQ